MFKPVEIFFFFFFTSPKSLSQKFGLTLLYREAELLTSGGVKVWFFVYNSPHVLMMSVLKQRVFYNQVVQLYSQLEK